MYAYLFVIWYSFHINFFDTMYSSLPRYTLHMMLQHFSSLPEFDPRTAEHCGKVSKQRYSSSCGGIVRSTLVTLRVRDDATSWSRAGRNVVFVPPPPDHSFIANVCVSSGTSVWTENCQLSVRGEMRRAARTVSANPTGGYIRTDRQTDIRTRTFHRSNICH
jgi:hypothetical protein